VSPLVGDVATFVVVELPQATAKVDMTTRVVKCQPIGEGATKRTGMHNGGQLRRRVSSGADPQAPAEISLGLSEFRSGGILGRCQPFLDEGIPLVALWALPE
jgi:putative component of membrane protein insertase Oxa1/YidC/SpoIIIJ protein YidD